MPPLQALAALHAFWVVLLVPPIALVGWLGQGESLRDLSGSPYPAFFARRALVVLDYYFLALVLVGLAFLCGGLVALRWGRYPRTDGSGATLVGTVLCALGGVVLFMRLWAALHG